MGADGRGDRACDDLRLRIRALIAPRRVERELDEELAFHIECETQKNIETGLSPAEARTGARARFGSVALAADQCRDARGTAFVDALVRDVLYAFRGFSSGPLAELPALQATRLELVRTMRGEVTRDAPFAYVAGPVVTACVLAASIPARRAARIDPITTLRHE